MLNWNKDLEYLKDQLFKLHPNPSHKNSSIKADFDNLQNKLDTLSEEETKVQLIHLIASIGDSHTSFIHWQSDFHEVPYVSKLFSDGIWITKVKPGYEEILGKRIVMFDKTPVKTAIEIVQPIIATENDGFTKLIIPNYLEFFDILAGLGLIESPKIFELTVSDLDGNQIKKTMKPNKTEADWKILEQPANPYFEPADKGVNYRFLKILAETIYLEYRNCYPLDRNSGISMEEFCLNFKEFVKINDAKKLVIDVRNNTGGNSFYNYPLIKSIIQVSDSFEDIIILIGRATFSAAGHFIFQLDQYLDCLFIGEDSGCSSVFYSDPEIITLPNSKMVFRICTSFWKMSHAFDNRLTRFPDFLINNDFKISQKHWDNEMRVALSYQQSKLSMEVSELVDLGEIKQFIQEYKKSKFRQLTPYNFQLSKNKIREFRATKKHEAATELSKFIYQYFDSYLAGFEFAETLKSHGNITEAVKVIEEVFEKYPENIVKYRLEQYKQLIN